ncbi:MAG: outer membrane protein [Tabrizicola flagellatus]|uniref:outer membrane protein n=1 Tax=Tabrizicola flagellatus TaxID=2593021 RepID=UPI00391DE268
MSATGESGDPVSIIDMRKRWYAESSIHQRGEQTTKKLALAATIATLGTPIFAGGPTIVAADPMPAAAPAPAATHDWSGPYAGLSYGRTSADITFNTSGFFDFENGNTAGIYGGYLFQRGSLVYGGELAYGKVSDTFVPGFGGDDEIDRALDLKARVGFAANRALFYGVLGYSQFQYVEPPTREFKLDGMAYGLGAELALGSRFVLGLEYLSRDGSGAANDDPTVTGDAKLNTLSLRVGLSF